MHRRTEEPRRGRLVRVARGLVLSVASVLCLGQISACAGAYYSRPYRTYPYGYSTTYDGPTAYPPAYYPPAQYGPAYGPVYDPGYRGRAYVAPPRDVVVAPPRGGVVVAPPRGGSVVVAPPRGGGAVVAPPRGGVVVGRPR